jgi:hypothetical protein
LIAEVEGLIAIFGSSEKITIMIEQESRSGLRSGGGRRERKELARD